MLLNIQDYRVAARKSLPKFVFDYIDGGADRELCLSSNSRAISEVKLLPSCLSNVSEIDTSVEIFGKQWSMPVGIAPTGFNGLSRPNGDLMLAKAAGNAGVPFCLSTASNVRLESVADQNHGSNWMQLYVMSDRSIAEQIMRRAARERYEALVLTVDVPVSGNRHKDIRNGFKLPFRPTIKTLFDLSIHPEWLLKFLFNGMPSFVNLAEDENSNSSAQLQAALLSRSMDKTLDWEQLKWIRSNWSGPLLLKGILNPKDAKLALNYGVDGVIVSNHGGRQLDASPATVQVLPQVVDQVAHSIPVLVDSGFYSGEDVVKALSIGAKAVLIGRPVLYGLASKGQQGVVEVLELFKTELIRTMTLLGASSIKDLNRENLWI